MTLLLHKLYGVLSQFSLEPGSRWRCLRDLLSVPGVYPAGRLDDAGGEGLLLLTDIGRLQRILTHPSLRHLRITGLMLRVSLAKQRR